MKKIMLGVALVLSMAIPSRAATTSRLLGLQIIPIGTLNWGTSDNNRIYQISSAAASQYDSNTFGLNGSTNTAAGAWLWIAGSSIAFADGAAFYYAPGTNHTSTMTAAGAQWAYGIQASTAAFGTASPASTATVHIAGAGNLSVDNKIQVGPNGICFDNGSCQTAAGGGGTVTTQGSPQAGQIAVFQGGTVISSAPFFVTPSSGVIASSSFTVNSFTVFGSTLTNLDAPGVPVKLFDWNTVATSSVTGASALWLYGFTSTNTYSIECNGLKHTAGTLNWTTSDTGANYNDYLRGAQGTNAPTNSQLTGQSVARITGVGTTSPVDLTGFSFKIQHLRTVFGQKAKVEMWGHTDYQYGTGNFEYADFNDQYTGSTAFTTLKISQSAGTFDLSCTVKQFYIPLALRN